MNIPLDRLYHYIQDIAQEIYGDRVIIYRFWPHGSKNINDLNHLHESGQWLEKTLYPQIWCNDQEPLDHEFYRTNQRPRTANPWRAALDILDQPLVYRNSRLNLDYNLNYNPDNIFEKSLLLHSEKRSSDLEKYLLDDKLIPVYYWSHAVIARDWFRYAEHVTQRKQVDRIFLIYNRAWNNTREYRLRFAELLVILGLQDSCRTSVNPVEPELGIHYDSHTFKNPALRHRTVLENFFPINNIPSHYSADFDIKDYEATDIEVVLETLFDDGRLHLTEKSLRPIAVGQPFIFAGTHGSLEYLHNYGFKTFNSVWDESYDTIEDPEQRLSAIADLMNQIKHWLPHVREQKIVEAREIASYNKKYFFSQEFFDLVVNELKINLTSTFNTLAHCNNFNEWKNQWKQLLSHVPVRKFLQTNQDINFPRQCDLDFILNLIDNKIDHVSRTDL